MKRGQCQFIIMGKNLVTIGKRWRSKWWQVKCFCSSYRRKDGTCKHERAVLESLKPEIKKRARIDVLP